jgi:hypothetical protein
MSRESVGNTQKIIYQYKEDDEDKIDENFIVSFL